jgi:uncharacterized protein YkwD
MSRPCPALPGPAPSPASGRRRPAGRSALGLLVAVTLTGGLTTAAGPPASATAASACTGAELVPTADNLATVLAATNCLVNQRRKSAGLTQLKGEVKLRRMGERFASSMVRENFFDHTSPDGATFERRLKASAYAAGRRSWSGGENLAWGTGSKATPSAIVSAWMASPGHRKNILGRGYRDTGIAIAIGAPDPTVDDGAAAATYVQEFGSRR